MVWDRKKAARNSGSLPYLDTMEITLIEKNAVMPSITSFELVNLRNGNSIK